MESKGLLERITSSSSSLEEALNIAQDLLGSEDTRLPGAFALLDRLKLPAADDDITTGPSKLLRLIGRFVGYNPAVFEQVLEALSISENPGSIIESLPLLVVGAGQDEVAKVVEALKHALSDDLAGLLLPVLGALFDLPLTSKLRREALGLAQEALAVVQDADVPVVVRTLLKTMDEQSDPSLLTNIRRECASLSTNSTALLMEVLSTALATNPRVARLFLMNIRMATTDLSIVDALVLVLLFSHPVHQAVVQDSILRFLATGPVLAPLLARLVENTGETHWSSLATPLAELAQWLLLNSVVNPRPRLALALEPAREAEVLAGHLIRRLFEIHPGLRDELLGFLMTLCVPALLRSGSSFPLIKHHQQQHHHSSSPSPSRVLEEEDRVREESRRRLTSFLPLMNAGRGILADLAASSPHLLIPYLGLLCDQLLNSASDLPPIVMGPLLRALTILARTHASSSVEMTLIIYIQKQLWTSTSTSGISIGGGGRPSWYDEAGVYDERRKLASLILAEALVLDNTNKRRGGGPQRGEDLSAIMTWIVRAVPVASPKVAAYGLRFLLRVLDLEQSAGDEEWQQAQGSDEEAEYDDDDDEFGAAHPSRRPMKRGLNHQIQEAAKKLAVRLGILSRLKDLTETDCKRLSYVNVEGRNATATITLPWRQESKSKQKASSSSLSPLAYPGPLSFLVSSVETDDLSSSPSHGATRIPFDLCSSNHRHTFAWCIERLVDEFVPGMVSSEPTGLGSLMLVRTLVRSLLELQLRQIENGGTKATCFELLASAPMLLLSWPLLRGRTGEQGLERWVEDMRLWREGGAGDKAAKSKRRDSRSSSKASGNQKKGSRREEVEVADDSSSSNEEDEWSEEEEEDVFRDRVGQKDRLLKAGWGALIGAMITGALLEAWASDKKANGPLATACGKTTLQTLLHRHVDLLQRVQRCLEKVSPPVVGKGGHRGGEANDPIRVMRSRRVLTRAFGAFSGRTSPEVLALLLEWADGDLAELQSIHEEEEETEEEEGSQVVKVDGPVLQLLRSILETEALSDEQARVLEGLPDKAVEGRDGEEGEGRVIGCMDGDKLLRQGDIELDIMAKMMMQVQRLNQLLRTLRRSRSDLVDGSSSSSGLQSRDVTRLLCLYLSYARRIFVKAGEQDAGRGTAARQLRLPPRTSSNCSAGGASSRNSSSSSRGGASSASASTAAAPEVIFARPLIGLTDLCQLCTGSSSTSSGTNGDQNEAREKLYWFLAHEAERADDEAVACGLLELLSCLTAGTGKAGTAACFEALRCLETAYPVVDVNAKSLVLQDHCHQDKPLLLPLSLTHVLRPSLGVHEVQTRVLLDLRKVALSISTSLSQRPVLRHFALTFWSLLSREHRPAGLLRLCKGIHAISMEAEQALRHDSKRKHRSKSTRETPRDLMVLRALTPESCPALLELVLQLSLTTLVLARPQAYLTESQKRQRGVYQSSSEEGWSPYVEVQASLIALVQSMKLAGGGLCGGPSNHMKRLASTVVRIASMSIAVLQWQVDRCITWRTGRGGSRSTNNEEIEAVREEEASLKHIQSLVENALSFTSVVMNMCQELKIGSKKSATRGSSSNKTNKKGSSQGGGGGGGRPAPKRQKTTQQQETSADLLTWSAIQGCLSDRQLLPRCILACEKLVEFLRDVCSTFRLPIKVRGAHQLAAALLGEEGGQRLLKEGMVNRLIDCLAAVKGRYDRLKGGVRRGDGDDFDEQLQERGGRGLGQWGGEAEEEDLGDGEDDDEEDLEEEEEEEDFYAIVSGGTRAWGQGSRGGGNEEEEKENGGDDANQGPSFTSFGWGGGHEEKEEEKEKEGEVHERRSAKRKGGGGGGVASVVVGGGGCATTTVSRVERGTVVVEFGKGRRKEKVAVY